MKHEILWLPEPEEHDFPAALSYLSLFFDEPQAQALVDELRTAPMSEFKAKDILRASHLPVLGISNFHVEHNRQKIKDGKRLSPILLVRGERLCIADGYHRVCCVYDLDEDALIPCKIV